jgi:hypothetical protein
MVAAVLLYSAPTQAGNNAGGTAHFSWSPSATVTDLATAPLEAAPLYLVLDGVPDLRQLAVEMRWSPNARWSPDGLIGPCYYLSPVGGGSAGCGWVWADHSEPPGVFEGDSSYTWRISFDPAGSPTCVVYLFFGSHCDGVPASFYLMSVKVKDSVGAVDELVVSGNATILGGVDSVGLVTVQSTSPRVVNSGEVAELTVHGTNFAVGASVKLRGDGITLQASSVTVANSNTLSAVVAVPDSADAPLDVIVSLPDGRSGLLEDAVETRELWWGLWLDSTVVLSGRAGSGVPLYRSDGNAGSSAGQVSRHAVAEVQSEPIMNATCHSVPYCTIPQGGTGLYSPSIVGPTASCPGTKPASNPTSITYFFCYSGPCTPSSPNKVVNLPLALEAYPKQITGGHCHADNNRPLNIPATGQVVAGNTGPSGLGFTVNWTWPELGGAVNAVLYTTSQDTFVFNAAKDTTSIYCVLVQNLELLTNGPGYSMVGSKPRHQVGWYGHPLLNQALRQLAVTVTDSMPSLPDLGYNDMSLVWGGLFDHQGTWDTPHCGHRLGSNCDLQTRTLMSSGLVDNELTRKLRRLIRGRGFKEPFRHVDHWHLTYMFPTGAN